MAKLCQDKTGFIGPEFDASVSASVVVQGLITTKSCLNFLKPPTIMEFNWGKGNS
jgi:hypothetical protein